jgi:hypothetical protein
MLLVLLLNFLVGDSLVVAFAVIAEAVRPRSFSGIFCAAPSIALANLGITLASDGPSVVRQEGIGMVIGALAMLIYVLVSEPAVRRAGSLIGCGITLLARFGVAAAGTVVFEAVVP